MAVKVDRICFCGQAEQATFGRLNLIEYIPGPGIAIGSVPYTLDAHAVIEGAIMPNSGKTKLGVKLRFQPEEGDEVEQAYQEGPVLPENGDAPRPFIVVVPVSIRFDAYGVWRIDIFADGSRVFGRDVPITAEDAPRLVGGGHLPGSGVIVGDFELAELRNIIQRADRLLQIADPYLEPDFISGLLKAAHPNVAVEIVASSDTAKKYGPAAPVKGSTASLEVRSSKRFHDRLLILNGTVFYHFGHSLKDLAGGRVSRFSRVTSAAEMAKLRVEFDNTWSAAAVRHRE